jgi:hypothetical protein
MNQSNPIETNPVNNNRERLNDMLNTLIANECEMTEPYVTYTRIETSDMLDPKIYTKYDMYVASFLMSFTVDAPDIIYHAVDSVGYGMYMNDLSYFFDHYTHDVDGIRAYMKDQKDTVIDEPEYVNIIRVQKVHNDKCMLRSYVTRKMYTVFNLQEILDYLNVVLYGITEFQE